MTDRLSAQVVRIGTLAEPVRRRLYLFVAGEPEAVSRERAAEGAQVALHTAKFHLDRLVEEGLLDVEHRRLTGRTGPGAGRPSKLYRRSASAVSVSLPERRYDLAGQILAAGVDRATRDGADVAGAVRDAAAEHGRRTGADALEAAATTTGAALTAGAGSGREQLEDVLTDQGYEPRARADDLTLVNCPFDDLARTHTALVCGMNEAFLGGVLDGLRCTGLQARLDPEAGLCCVKIRPAP